MAISIRSMCKWKYDNGYTYVAIDEDTGKLTYIKANELLKWYKESYENYKRNFNKEDGLAELDFDDYCKNNRPDKIENFISKEEIDEGDPDAVIICSFVNGITNVMIAGSNEDVSEMCKKLVPALQKYQ